MDATIPYMQTVIYNCCSNYYSYLEQKWPNYIADIVKCWWRINGSYHKSTMSLFYFNCSLKAAGTVTMTSKCCLLLPVENAVSGKLWMFCNNNHSKAALANSWMLQLVFTGFWTVENVWQYYCIPCHFNRVYIYVIYLYIFMLFIYIYIYNI